MPVVQIHLVEGRSDELKAKLVKKVTEAICDSINVSPERVKIILSEMAANNFAEAGILLKDKQ